jgi:ABC-2 type transport system permease protein
VVVIVCTAALLGMMMLGTWAGLRLLAPANAEWPSRSTVLSLAANLALLMICWSGIAMAIGSYVRRRATAGAFAGLLALASFLLDYVARAWRPAVSVAWLSPFRYFSQFELLQGKPLPVHSVLVLAGIGAGGFAVAYLIFSRRDIMH